MPCFSSARAPLAKPAQLTAMLARALSLVQRQVVDVEQLWVAGLALMQLYVVSRLPIEGEPYEWTQYILLGTLFPILVVVLLSLSRLAWAGRIFVKPAQRCLAFGCLAASAHYCWQHSDHVVLMICFVQCALLGVIASIQWRLGKENAVGTASEHWMLNVVLIGLAWTACVRLFWWESFEHHLNNSAYAVSVFCGSLLLITLNLSRSIPANDRRPSWLIWTANLVAFLIFALAAMRIDYACPFSSATYHHWSAIVGPAELVRQGGWLLWDVPSQYGFLSTLAVAWLPTDSVWQSLYLVQTILLTVTGCFLFLLLRNLGRGLGNWLFSLAVTLAAVFFVPGRPQDLYGYNTPAVGPFRFFWCFALLMVLAWQYRRPAAASAKWLGFGSLIWLLGTLWSAESAVYSAAIWLPAYGLLVWRSVTNRYPCRQERRKRMALAVLWYGLPAALLTIAWAVISFWYLAQLGHGPDWPGYAEYCLAFSAFALPIDPNGAVWVLFMVFCALSMVAVRLSRHLKLRSGLILVAGAWSALWAAASYFVGRSHEINLTNLSPFIVAAGAVACWVPSREGIAARLAGLVRLCLIPVLTMLLTIAFGNETRSPTVLKSLRRGYIRNIDRLLPEVDGSVAQLLESAGVRRSDPIALMHRRRDQCNCLPARWLRDDSGDTRLVSAYRAWLPITPYSLALPLPNERTRTYLERFTARTHLSGWLLYTSINPNQAWLFDELQQSHVASKTFERGDWKLTWFQWKEEENFYPCEAKNSALGNRANLALDFYP